MGCHTFSKMQTILNFQTYMVTWSVGKAFASLWSGGPQFGAWLLNSVSQCSPKGRRKGLSTITKSHIKLWELSVWSGPWQPTTHIWKGQSSWIQALWSFHTLDIRDTLLFLINSELVTVCCEDQGQWHSNFFFWLQNFHSNGKCPRLPRIIHTKHSCPD